MMDIERNLDIIRAELPAGVCLAAVSKTHPEDMILQAYNAGQRIFAENKVQEMNAKAAALPADIEWHFIGHVQRNKIRLMAPYVSMIQGVDTMESLAEIDRQAKRFDRIIECLLQIHIATEESKFGFTPDECTAMLDEGAWRGMANIRIAGVMGMATNTSNEQQVLSEFMTLKDCFDTYRSRFFSDCNYFRIISAGMSSDYRLAIQAGSNMVRIGSAIFGARDYTKSN